MSEPKETYHSPGTYDPPQDTGPPDAVETDPAALSSAEDLDEDRLNNDPLEKGMDPPEHWSGVDKYGMTPQEGATSRPIAERLTEEQPDVQPPTEEDFSRERYEEGLGTTDIAGESVPEDEADAD